MEGVDRLRRRRSLQDRLGIKGIICCGSTWGIGSSTMSIRGGDDDDNDLIDQVDEHIDLPDVVQTQPESNSDPDCVFPSPRMNLADALAAERDSRSTTVAADLGESLTPHNENNNRSNRNTTPPRESPTRMSLMRLLEETDDQDEKVGVGMDLVCCVCMGRRKSAAFIPCGHTFCRVCSRELWLNRGACPLCNRSITEVLDIY